MPHTDVTIQGDAARLLQGIVGETITRLGAAIVARDDMAWKTVRLCTQAAAIDVSITLQNLPINDEGDTEEFGVLSVAPVASNSFRPEGASKEPEWRPINQQVTDVMLVNSHVSAVEAGRVIMERSYTQAIVLALADGTCLALDKGPWFSEMIAICRGEAWDELIYNDSQDWQNSPEEPALHYKWHQSPSPSPSPNPSLNPSLNPSPRP